MGSMRTQNRAAHCGQRSCDGIQVSGKKCRGEARHAAVGTSWCNGWRDVNILRNTASHRCCGCNCTTDVWREILRSIAPRHTYTRCLKPTGSDGDLFLTNSTL